MRLVVTGGGTGGHIYPAIAVARHVADKTTGSEVFFIGSSAGPEVEAARAAGIPFTGLKVSGLVGKSPVKGLKAVMEFLGSQRRCRGILEGIRADCVLGTGGYAAAPACYAAVRMGIPLVLHEMNYEPGIVTKLLSGRASAVAVAFEGTAGLVSPKARLRVTGVPVRPEIENLATPEGMARSREEAIGGLGLRSDRKTLLVFGGSQGAEAINAALWSVLPGIASRPDLQILHVTGRRDYDGAGRVEAEARVAGGGLAYRTFDYMERMDLAYAAADLALSRAGAGTLAELTAVGLPSVLVPFPHAAGGHQEKNANALARTGAALVSRQVGGSARQAVELALRTIDDEDSLEKMKRAAAAATPPSGAGSITELIEEVT